MNQNISVKMYNSESSKWLDGIKKWNNEPPFRICTELGALKFLN